MSTHPRLPMPPCAIRPVLALALLLPVGHLAAQMSGPPRLYARLLDRDVQTLGLVALHGPRYAGADESWTQARPFFDLQWRNGWFAGLPSGVGYDFSSLPFLNYGLRLTLDFGRSENRSDQLTGLGDVPRRPEAGGFVNMALSRTWSVASSLRYGGGADADGVVWDGGVQHSRVLAPGWRWGSGLGWTWANASWMQSYHGITAEQATRSIHPAYQASAGLRDLRLSQSLSWQVDTHWSLMASASLTRWMGDAKHSPLTRDSQTENLMVLLSYRF